MHGGKSNDACKGNKNAHNHGHYPVREIARRMAMRHLLRCL